MSVLAAAFLPFLVGYFIAVRVLFPPPKVVGKGVPVPDLTGMTAQEAEQQLSSLGLGGLEITHIPSSSRGEGQIAAQSPLPGQQLRAGATVRVAISSGPPRVSVPDVLGFPVERAASLLTRLGFQVQRLDEPSFTEPGRVIRIEPEPGNELTLPARVTIVVSAALDSTGAGPTARDTLSSGMERMSFRWSGTERARIFARDRRDARAVR